MTCKNCIHYKICNDCFDEFSPCNDFKDKSRYIELPVKVGQTVYFIDHDFDVVFKGKLVSYSLDAAHLWFNCHYESGLNMWHTIERFGKDVFLTREEAETALKGE